MSAAARDGLLRSNWYYESSWHRSGIESFFARAAVAHGGRIDAIDWAKLRGTLQDDSGDIERGSSQHDALIVVPKSTLVTLRKRSAGGQPEVM